MPFFYLVALVFCFNASNALGTGIYDVHNAGTLSEADQDEAKNYHHDAHVQEFLDKQCSQKGSQAGKSDLCQNDKAAFDSGTWQTIESMMPAVTKAYAIFLATAEFSSITGMGGSGMMPDFLQLKGPVKKNDEPVLLDESGNEYVWEKSGEKYVSSNPVGEDGKKVELSKDQTKNMEEKQETKSDWCIFFPAATELGTHAYLGLQNSNMQTNIENSQNQGRQRMALEAIKESQKNLQYTSAVQAGGWGAASLCYTLRLFGDLSASNPAFWIRLGAATALGTFYTVKAVAHDEREDAIAELLKDFPQSGDCNPHTDTTCFCSNEASYQQDQKNYMRYCVPAPISRGNDPNGAFPCVSADGKADPECHCSKTNSCMQARIAREAMNIGLNPAKMKDPLAGLTAAQQGYGTGQLEDFTRRSLAMAKSKLGELKPRQKLNLNGGDMQVAKALQDMGFPAAAAAQFAGQTSSVPSNNLPQFAAFTPSSNTNAAFRNQGASTSSNKNKSKMVKGDTLAPKRQQRNLRSGLGANSNARGTSAIEIENFAQKAAREAEITKDKSRPLFDIISRRYQVRAWREFDEQMRKEIKEK